MRTEEYLHAALRALEERVEHILVNPSLSLTQKDHLMYSIVHEKEVLSEALTALKCIAPPPTQCKVGRG